MNHGSSYIVQVRCGWTRMNEALVY